MKKLTSMLWICVISTAMTYAGGLVTNTNGSAAWARTLSRDATLGVDAVYFNPAGLSQLKNGLHLSISNQSIFQTRTITSEYPYLADAPESVYQAELSAPLFPSIYAAFKMKKLTISAGFNIIGGGGSANFEAGLPSFEIPVSSIVPLLQQQLGTIDQGIIDAGFPDPGFRNVSGYNVDASFNGSSSYMGFQLGATYAINDMISIAIGGRYVMASNSYEGALKGVTIDAPAAYGGTQTPGNYLRTVAMTPGLGGPVVGLLNGTASALDVATADAELEAIQKGSGITPIIGLNLHLTDMLNVAVKYEHHTKIELTNETTVDDVGMFPDEAMTRADLPGMLAVGAQFKPIKKLSASVGFNYFMDIPAFYGNMDENLEQVNNESTIDNNAYTVSAGIEYKLMPLLGVSGGFSTGNLGVNELYQSDMTYALKSKTVAGGVFVDIGKMLTLNAGIVFVMYDDFSKEQAYQPTGFPAAIPFTDTFGKNTMIIAVGVDISL